MTTPSLIVTCAGCRRVESVALPPLAGLVPTSFARAYHGMVGRVTLLAHTTLWCGPRLSITLACSYEGCGWRTRYPHRFGQVMTMRRRRLCHDGIARAYRHVRHHALALPREPAGRQG